jgi:hypothetical protein
VGVAIIGVVREVGKRLGTAAEKRYANGRQTGEEEVRVGKVGRGC